MQLFIVDFQIIVHNTIIVFDTVVLTRRVGISCVQLMPSSDMASKKYKAIFGHFYTYTGENTYTCLCGTSRRQNLRNGYNNLISHVTTGHPDLLEIMGKTKEISAAGYGGFAVTEKGKMPMVG